MVRWPSPDKWLRTFLSVVMLLSSAGWPSPNKWLGTYLSGVMLLSMAGWPSSDKRIDFFQYLRLLCGCKKACVWQCRDGCRDGLPNSCLRVGEV